jgi:hypothetical protein
MENEILPRRFDFDRDRLGFANDLLWEYQPNLVTGRMDCRPYHPRPEYHHRCFVLTRVVRQFLFHVRFEAARKMVDERAYRRLLRQALARTALKPCAVGEEIVIPGYSCLFEFSKAREKLFKAECGGAWRCYVLRSHWRMIFPISRAHQQCTAEGLVAALAKNIAPIIHLVKFPSLTINHGMTVYASTETAEGYEFLACDPNNLMQPSRLSYRHANRTFYLPANRYWIGGDLNIIQIYQSWWM